MPGGSISVNRIMARYWMPAGKAISQLAKASIILTATRWSTPKAFIKAGGKTYRAKGLSFWQRNAATLWSSDIFCGFGAFKNQVPQGINACASGIPYWTSDIGGYQYNWV